LIFELKDWRETSKPGSVPPIIIAWQCLYFAIIGLAMNLLYALNKATARKIANNKTSEHSGSGVLPDINKPVGIKTDMDTQAQSVRPKSPTAASSMAAYQIDDKM